MRQTVGDILHVVSHTNPPQNMNNTQQVTDNVLATCMHATRCAVNALMETSPGAIVNNRDMLLDIPLVANLGLVQERRQQLVNDNLRRQNAQRVDYKWKVRDQFNIVIWEKTKGSQQLEGSFTITATKTNGTDDFRHSANVTENISIREIQPH